MRFPQTVDDVLSPSWLTSVLSRRFAGVEIVTATRGPSVSRVSTNVRFEIECREPRPDGLPRHLCAKGYFTEATRHARQAGEPEVLFYRDLVERTDVRTLSCLFAELDPVTADGVVITEDVAASGATFLDALTPFSPAQARASLEQYASLHGSTWEDHRLADLPWLAPRLARTLRARGLREIERNFEGPIGAGVPLAVRDAERLVAAVSTLAEVEPSLEPRCLLHGDAHIGNLYLDASGRPCLADWQLVHRGPWYLDVGYHIASALTVSDRRSHEDQLLTDYLDTLGSAGGSPPSGEEARAGCCLGLVYGFFLWAITVMVNPLITASMLERLGTAVADHDALSTVEGLSLRDR